MIKLLINIEEETFKELTKYDKPVPSGNCLYDSILESIFNGTPLPPKTVLIDIDKLEPHDEYDGQGFTKSVYKDDIDNALTIIEENSESIQMTIKALEDKVYEQGYKEGYTKGFEEGVVSG